MNSPTLFGMVTTAKSSNFTYYALNSFFSTVTLNPQDLFVLIDNDNVWEDFSYPNVRIIRNKQPLSFAANINQLISIADSRDLDLIMLNNDLVFTPGWRDALESSDDVICLPSCNQTHVFTNDSKEPIFPPSLTVSDYNNNWELLCQVAQIHKSTIPTTFEKLHTPYYAFRLPKSIYRIVGLFSEDYGKGGGEDVDYRIRAAMQGFRTVYTTQSYILHFHGKSTWNGAEDSVETKQRNDYYFSKFIEKWGDDAANLFLQTGNNASIIEKYNLTYEQLGSYETLTRLLFNREKIVGNHTSIVPINLVSAPGLLKYVEELGTNLVGCELGVSQAFTLRYFLDSTKNIKKIYAVDAWKAYMDWHVFHPQEEVDGWKRDAFSLMADHMDRIQILEMDTAQASKMIPDNSLDYIFIDGDHSFAAASRDMRNYWRKVKSGGIFAGHDWQLPAVSSAVKLFRKEYKITTEIQFTESNVWFWRKE